MTSHEAMVVLNMLEGIGPVRVRRLLEVFGSSEAILNASASRLRSVPGIGAEVADSIQRWESQVNLAEELRACESFGCQVITQLDEAYPSQLRQIYDPPLVLYVKGTIEQRDQNAIAMVGSRMTTHYGREVARKLAYQLASAGVTVVSGGARGIDAVAHRATLAAKGRSFCVLGNGINLVYPPENRDLFEALAASGAVMTQFPFNRKADRQTFPIRNRIVAGLTLGTVVVEANANSGALITANMANDCGRQVFAVPGPVHSPRSKGCHQLIKNGAKLCETVEDILCEFEYLFPMRSSGSAGGAPLSESERQLLEWIGAAERHIDELVRESGLSIAALSVSLLQLEMKGWIVQRPGHHYVLAPGRSSS